MPGMNDLRMMDNHGRSTYCIFQRGTDQILIYHLAKGAIAGCHAGVPLLGAIVGCHCWGAIAGVPCWGAIAGCHCEKTLTRVLHRFPLHLSLH